MTNIFFNQMTNQAIDIIHEIDQSKKIVVFILNELTNKNLFKNNINKDIFSFFFSESIFLEQINWRTQQA